MSDSEAVATTPQSPNSSIVLTASYLEKHKDKNDLVRRLALIADILHTEEVEADSPEYPGLAALAACLVQQFLEHRDKDVRMYTVLCCMELFAVYVPEAPWNETEVCSIFQQTIRQLANLAHTTQTSQENFKNYLRILEHLAITNTSVVLVELGKDALEEQEYSDEDTDNPTELLAELFRTILQSLRVQHPPEVSDHAQKCLIGCLEEYSDGMVPIPILDEILICLGQGPTISVTVPGKVQPTEKGGSKRKQLPPAPQKVEQPNRSYMLAASIIRKLGGKFHNDVSFLLNGLINNETHIIERSSIGGAHEEDNEPSLNNNQSGVDVWSIVYELSRVSPPILTTVIGTISGCLESPEFLKRQKVVKLLGRLFYAKGSKLASKYSPCFRQWLHRYIDVEYKIRLDIVYALTSIIKVNNSDPDVVKQSEEVLMRLLEDNKIDVRLEAIHSICDMVFEGQKDCAVSGALLRAVGERVKSKDKIERRDALTGIAQIYYRHYMSGKLEEINNAGDDCEIDLILKTLSENCSFSGPFPKVGGRKKHNDSMDAEQDKYGWIPKRIFESLFYTDQFDSEMRNRVIQIIDDVILGSELSKNKSKKLSPTARAVGLAIILDSVREDGESIWGDDNIRNNSLKLLSQFLLKRVTLQKCLSNYIDARSSFKEYETRTEESYTAEAKAMERLELLGSMVPAPSGAPIGEILNALHSARDKHIFRILASVSQPLHGRAARSRAMDELPKRTKALGDPVVAWVKTLVRRCTMGDFISAEIIQHCVLLALECFNQGDISSCVGLLSCVKFAVSVVPTLCDAQSFTTLTELFAECQSLSYSKSKKNKDEKKLVDESGIVTALSSILSIVAPTLKDSKIAEELQQESQSHDGLKKRLLQLCTHDGTPEQARHAVRTMATLCFPRRNDATIARDHIAECESFAPLLKELTSPSKMTIAGPGENPSRVVTLLAAMGALAQCAPAVFNQSTRSEKALRFALETVLMGRGHKDNSNNSSDGESSADENESDDDKDGDDEASTKQTPKRKSTSTRDSRRSLQHKSPAAGCSLIENADLSLPCRRVCAAIEFLVSYIRSTILARISVPSSERIKTVFSILTGIIQNQGMPPSNRDRKDCRARQDRAAIRQCATVQLLRLCDSRLNLEDKYLSQSDFHILAGSFLDDEKVVREAAIDELCFLLTGKGVYGENGKPFPPKLRFLALVALSADGEHSTGHSRANGGAANVGKKAANTKLAAQDCMTKLRCLLRNMYSHLVAAKGQQTADSEFEKTKLDYMPEYCIPYCYHMLAFRRETPTNEVTSTKNTTKQKRNGEERDCLKNLEESQQKMLRKRLKWMFAPIVASLGETVDNISFLLQMTSLLSDYVPLNAKASSTPNRQSLDSTLSSPDSCMEEVEDTTLPQAKLKTVCFSAKEVLMKFVKKDSHLAEHPGAVHIPSTLFEKLGKRKRSSRDSVDERAKKSPKSTPAQEKVAPNTVESAKSFRSVTFSPALVGVGESTKFPIALDLSPIESEQETKTLSPGDGFGSPFESDHIHTKSETPSSDSKMPAAQKVSARIGIGHTSSKKNRKGGKENFFSFDDSDAVLPAGPKRRKAAKKKPLRRA